MIYPKVLKSIVLLTCLVLVSGQVFAITERKDYDETFNILPNSTVIIKNKNGEVIINVWNQNRVRIKAEIRVDARSSQAEKELIQNVFIESAPDSQKIVFTSVAPDHVPIYKKKGRFGFGGGSNKPQVEIRYEVWIPAQVNIDIQTSKGKVSGSDILGNVRVSTTEEKVTLKNMLGSVKAYTTNAKVQVELNNLNSEVIEIATTNADIDVSFPSESALTLKAKAIGGEIRSDFDITRRGIFSKETKFGWINGGGVKVNLYTQNGKIVINKS